MNELVQMMKSRRSVRQFENKPVPPEIIEDILDCARLAPTAINIQPWLFGAVTDPELKRQIAALTDYGKFIEHCAATENILLACTAYGIGSCWVAGHKKAYADSVKKVLNVPEPYTLTLHKFNPDDPVPSSRRPNSHQISLGGRNAPWVQSCTRR